MSIVRKGEKEREKKQIYIRIAEQHGNKINKCANCSIVADNVMNNNFSVGFGHFHCIQSI